MSAGFAQQLALVAAGGALGSVGRFVMSDWIARHAHGPWPWGTFTVNLLGSLLAGLALAWLDGRGDGASAWRAFLVVGVLGGLTTWSTLVVELMVLQRGNGAAWALGYVGASLAGGVALLVAGLRLGAVLRATGG